MVDKKVGQNDQKRFLFFFCVRAVTATAKMLAAEALRALLPSVDETTLDYIGDMIVSIIEGKPANLAEELCEEVGPMLEDHVGSPEESAELCSKLAAMILGVKIINTSIRTYF